MYNLLLDSVNWGKFGIILAICAALAIVFAILILVVSKLTAVKEDPKIAAIQENLAGANCGGCGYAGCADYAKALAEGKAKLSDCGTTSNEGKAKIAEIIGEEFVGKEPVYAVVHCAGGDEAGEKYRFIGNYGCTNQGGYLGGKKICPTGCMGAGTCQEKCQFNAIRVQKGVALVDKALCEACGVCVNNCPKHLISLIPKSAKVYVACSTPCKGKETINACKSGCIACGICAKNCPENAITMVNNLPIIDYSKCSGCRTCSVKCPRKCIKEI